jgi:hypothetical protein
MEKPAARGTGLLPDHRHDGDIDSGREKKMVELAQTGRSLLDTVVEEDAEHPLAELVAGIIEDLSNEAFAAACDATVDGNFRALTGWSVRDVDALWIRGCRCTFRGSAAAWTIEVRLGVDSDCGNRDHDLLFAGACSLGVTRFDSVARA